MEIISGTTEFRIPEATAVAIGKFDGIHLGHRKLIEILRSKKEEGLKTVIFTFDPSPAVFFSHSTASPGELMTRDEKREAFRALGIDYLFEFPMNRKTAATDPELFIREYLQEKMNARVVVAGDDLSYGDRGRGNFALMKRMAEECGFAAEQVSKVTVDNVVVSSTYIRNLVETGRMEEAAKMLGEPFGLSGTIRHGNQIGRTIGIPTLNQIPSSGKLLPPFGVYYSDVSIKGTTYHGMTNIGIKPTIEKGKTPGERPPVTVETYLYDFSGDVYGETACTSLYTYRRGERKFSSLEALTMQMQQDIEAGRRYHAKRDSLQLENPMI